MHRYDKKRLSLWSMVALVVAFCVFWQPYEAGADWQERWETVVREGKQEGTVVIFGPPGDPIRQALTENFQRAFPGIRVEYLGGRGGQLASKIRAERGAGIYSVDVILGGTTTSNILMRPMGAADPVKPILILPEVLDTSKWRDNRLEYSDATGRDNLVFITNVNTPLAYNLQQVKPEEIDEVHELLDPKWKGKIVVANPLPPGPANATFRLIWKALGPQKAEDFYRKIRRQAGAVERDARRMLEWISRGKYSIILGANSTTAQVLLKRGLKFGVLPEFKDIGGMVTASYGSLMLANKAPHPKAATVFINWLLTKEGQTAWSKAMFDASRRIDVPRDHLPSFRVPTGKGKYWWSYFEKDVQRSREEEKILKELFGR